MPSSSSYLLPTLSSSYCWRRRRIEGRGGTERIANNANQILGEHWEWLHKQQPWQCTHDQWTFLLLNITLPPSHRHTPSSQWICLSVCHWLIAHTQLSCFLSFPFCNFLVPSFRSFCLFIIVFMCSFIHSFVPAWVLPSFLQTEHFLSDSSLLWIV